MDLSEDTLRTAGILFLTIVAVQFGGAFLLRVATGKEAATDFQTSFYRAGHAHAGVLVILSLIVQIYMDAVDASLAEGIARRAIPVAAVLMPAGFFLSAIGSRRTEPNKLIVLVFLGATSLACGVLAAGVALLTV